MEVLDIFLNESFLRCWNWKVIHSENVLMTFFKDKDVLDVYIYLDSFYFCLLLSLSQVVFIRL